MAQKEPIIYGYKAYAPNGHGRGDPDRGIIRWDEPEEEKELTTLDRAVRVMTWGILSFCLALWTVVGFIFWVPILLREMVRFSFALSEGMLRGAPPSEAGQVLRDAVEFYRRGFTVAIDAVFKRNEESDEDHGKKRSAVKFQASRVVYEVSWTIIFWYVVMYLVGIVDVSPLGAWGAVAELPWGDVGQAFVDWVAGIWSSIMGVQAPAA